VVTKLALGANPASQQRDENVVIALVTQKPANARKQRFIVRDIRRRKRSDHGRDLLLPLPEVDDRAVVLDVGQRIFNRHARHDGRAQT